MENIIRDVRDIDSADRLAIEHIVGMPLQENQRLIIGIMMLDDDKQPTSTEAAAGDELPDWCNIYDV